MQRQTANIAKKVAHWCALHRKDATLQAQFETEGDVADFVLDTTWQNSPAARAEFLAIDNFKAFGKAEARRLGCDC